jgi:hypothetical protein
MRASPSLTAAEVQAFTQFALDHDIIVDGEVGIQNANTLCGPIVETDSDITAQALSDSFAKVKSQLRIKSAMYRKAEALSSKLNPDEVAAYQAWANHPSQKLLILDHSEEGVQNLSALLGWLRGNQVSGHSLDLALGNCIHNSRDRIHFRPQPKQERPYGPGGKLNHAFGQTEEPKKAAAVGVQQQEYVNGRKNHAYTPPGEAAKKVAAQPVDSWQEIIDLHMKEWVTPSQQVKLQNELNAGLAAGRSRRDIAMSLGALVKDQRRGR